MIYVFVVVLLLRHILLTAEILLSSLEKKDHWRTKISTLWDHHGSLCLAWSLSLTRWTGLGIKRVAIRAMLIQLGLRLLPANVFLHEREMDKMGNSLAKQSETETCAYRDLSPPQHLRSSCCTQLVDCMWVNRAQDYSWMSVGGQTVMFVKVDGQRFPDLELSIWRGRNVFMHICMLITEYT